MMEYTEVYNERSKKFFNVEGMEEQMVFIDASGMDAEQIEQEIIKVLTSTQEDARLYLENAEYECYSLIWDKPILGVKIKNSTYETLKAVCNDFKVKYNVHRDVSVRVDALALRNTSFNRFDDNDPATWDKWYFKFFAL